MDDGTDSDADLVAAIVEGDAHALRALYDRHAAWLLVRSSCATMGEYPRPKDAESKTVVRPASAC